MLDKLILRILLIASLVLIQGETFVIDATRNAVDHNSNGIMFMEEGYLSAAAAEFKIAIALNPNTTATATFYNNLGLVYSRMHKYNWAISSYKKAIELNPSFLAYYRNLIKAYKAKKILSKEVNKNIALLKANKSNSMAWLMLGLMYQELNYRYDAVVSLKQFRRLEPNLLLTGDVNKLITKLESKK